MKKCPMYAEDVQDEAIKCKHCGEMLLKPESKPTRLGNICPRCSKEYDYTWKICLDCRVPLTKKEVDAKSETAQPSDGSMLKCPRCGFIAAPGELKDAYSDTTCCCLAFIMVLPAILYYFFRQGKKVCPQCKNVF